MIKNFARILSFRQVSFNVLIRNLLIADLRCAREGPNEHLLIYQRNPHLIACAVIAFTVIFTRDASTIFIYCRINCNGPMRAPVELRELKNQSPGDQLCQSNSL